MIANLKRHTHFIPSTLEAEERIAQEHGPDCACDPCTDHWERTHYLGLDLHGEPIYSGHPPTGMQCPCEDCSERREWLERDRLSRRDWVEEDDEIPF